MKLVAGRTLKTEHAPVERKEVLQQTGESKGSAEARFSLILHLQEPRNLAQARLTLFIRLTGGYSALSAYSQDHARGLQYSIFPFLALLFDASFFSRVGIMLCAEKPCWAYLL